MDPSIKLPLAAGVSGIIEVFATHWIDRIKTKMQEITLKGTTSNLKSATKNIYLTSGLGGFYSGIIPRLMGIVPMRVMYWTTMVKMNLLVENQSVLIKYIAPGLISGAVQTLLDNPIEVIKIRLMTKGPVDTKNGFPINIKTLYAGFIPTIIRNSIFAVAVASIVKKYEQENKFLIGAVGGLVGSILSQPFDVIKTELQRHKTINVQNKSAIEMLSIIAKEHPLRLWTGGSMRCALGFLNMGIGFYTLEHIQKYLEE